MTTPSNTRFTIRQKLLFLLLLLCACSSHTFSQQPSYYQLGEEQFSGINIYGLLQDQEGYIWVCSNSGLFRYNGYEYERFDHPAMKNQSVFNPKLDNRGDFYCNNLSGQFFKYEKDSLLLFYTLPDSLKSYNILYEFNATNEMVISSKDIYKLDQNKQLSFVMSNSGSPSSIFRYEDGSLLLYDLKTNAFNRYENNQLTAADFESLSELGLHNFGPYNAYKVYQETLYLFDPKNLNFLAFEDEKWSQKGAEIKKQNESIAYCLMNDMGLWLANQNRGMRCYNYQGEPFFNDQLILNDFQISAGCEDFEGNLWLGTLGKGLIVIPRIKMIDFNNHSPLQRDEIKCITHTNDGKIICGGYNGILYEINHDSPSVLHQSANKIDFLHYLENLDLLLYNNSIAQLKNQKLNQIKEARLSSIKDIYVLNSSESIVATNVHPYIYRFNVKDSTYSKLFQKYPSYFYSGKIQTGGFEIGRSNAIYFDELRQEIWVATLNGIKIISEKGINSIEHKGRILGVLKIIQVKDEVWVGTSKQGIIIFKNKKFQRQLNQRSGLLSDYLIKMKRFDNSIIISTDRGVQIINTETEEKIQLDKIDGLLSNRILDFTLVGNELWLVSNKGVQKIVLDDITSEQIKPTISFKRIIVNEAVIDMNQTTFDYTENKFEFEFMSLAFSHRGSLIYEYRLLGQETDWNQTSYELNSAKYSSLSPGEYTFEIRAINEHELLSEKKQFSFSIMPPFWNTWWFYLMVIAMIIGIVTTYFLIRISIIRRRLEIQKQLKASEVTAIKAQMNPHFVFNALNSVQDLILQNDIRESNIYLGKFSDLMRKTLEYSAREHISIGEEAALLKLYLDLEKLRFGDDFKITFQIELRESELHEYQIPSMILQPYVENAVKHGLLHKSGIKNLTIRFKKTNYAIQAEIQDNGIGRKASQEIQKRQANHQSFASSATQKRIDLINEINIHKIDLSIEDVIENEKVAGTLVTFNFPLKN